MTIYLLHFDQPIGKPQTASQREKHGLPPRTQPYKAHAQHYIGYSEDVDNRVNGHDAVLVKVAKKQGITFTIARLWEGDRALERKLKNRKKAPLLCPICNPNAMKLANY